MIGVLGGCVRIGNFELSFRNLAMVQRNKQGQGWLFRGLALGAVLMLVWVFWWWLRGALEPSFLSEGVVWAELEPLAESAGLEPEFVYAIAWAESSLNAKARNGRARGLMQLTPLAWEEVSERPFRDAWRWRVNLEVGVDYLAFCRDFLVERDAFSYRLLAASYRYGPYAVAAADFELSNLEEPRNLIYQELWRGHVSPVEVPDS